MKIANIATSIFIENMEPSYTSVPAIAYYLRNKIGALNNLIFENYKISEDGYEIVDGDNNEINIDAVEILKQLYKIYDLEVQIRNNMNSISSDDIIQVNDNFGGAGYRRINKNEISKTLATIRKDEMEILDKLVGSYKIKNSNPWQTASDDCVPGIVYPYPNPYLRTL